KGLPMRRKMLYGYSLPIIFVVIILFTISGLVLQGYYREQMEYSVEQAQAQADGFLSSRLQGMRQAANMIAVDEELHAILADPAFGEHRNQFEINNEYTSLLECFHRLELSNGAYHIGIFLPDGIQYTNHQYFFYKETELTYSDNYQEITERLEEGLPAYSIFNETRTANLGIGEPYLTLLRKMTVLREDGERRDYVIRVGIRVSDLENVLRNTRTSDTSIVYLLDPEDRCAARSDNELRTPSGEPQLLPELPGTKLQNWSAVSLPAGDFFYVGHRISEGNWYLISLIPLYEYQRQFLLVLVWVLIAAILIAETVAVISYLISRYYAGRITAINRRMEEVQKGEINAFLPQQQEMADDEMDALDRNYDVMLQAVQKLMKEQYRLGKNISRAEMRALQAQINPHFLYNTLDLINFGAMDYGADKVAQIARSLGQFYRLSLNHGKAAISIEDELRHVEAFVAIENAHYEDAITLEIDVPEQIRQLACLNITLQPFVENSIVHGIGEHPEITSCRIRISAVQEEDDILFTVEDDGPGISPEVARQIEENTTHDRTRGYGISNINFRIRLCYGESYGVRYLTDRETQASSGGKSIQTDGFSDGPADKAAADRPGTTVQIRIRALNLEELEKLLA
ncbi:MAG: histidine kinase, partial [Lachnospiraceae bacterium]|nr:histidine kinase [Lachnospiraceae bacterium]